MDNLYIINKETVAILSKYDFNGNEYSLVFEGENHFHVKVSPMKIVEDSFKYTGSDYKGARNGARSILKMSYKVPVVYSVEHGIVLIKCEPPSKNGDVWLISSYIDSTAEYGHSKTKVLTTYGQEIIVGMRHKSLQLKMSQASFLLETLKRRSNIQPLKFFYRKNKGIVFIDEDKTPYKTQNNDTDDEE